jgi:hypothetical protein
MRIIRRRTYYAANMCWPLLVLHAEIWRRNYTTCLTYKRGSHHQALWLYLKLERVSDKYMLYPPRHICTGSYKRPGQIYARWAVISITILHLSSRLHSWCMQHASVGDPHEPTENNMTASKCVRSSKSHVEIDGEYTRAAPMSLSIYQLDLSALLSYTRRTGK